MSQFTETKTESAVVTPVEQFFDGVEKTEFTRLEVTTEQPFGLTYGVSGYNHLKAYLEQETGLHAPRGYRDDETAVVMIARDNSILLGVTPHAHKQEATPSMAYVFTGGKGVYHLESAGRVKADDIFTLKPQDTIMFGWVSRAAGGQAAAKRKPGPPMYETYRALMGTAERAMARRVGRRVFGRRST